MISFEIITIFPKFFDSFLKESLIKRAQEKGLISIKVLDLRQFAKDPRKSVDDRPFGGGRGMVIKLEPFYKALRTLKIKNLRLRRTSRRLKNSKTILFSPRGRKFTQKTAYQYSKLKRIVMVCGRYEGIDERVAKNLVDEQISIGDYVLMGGEIPAMALMEAITRLIPGVLGHSELLGERIPKQKGRGGRGFSEYPQYTRPEVFVPKKGSKWRVPKVLLSGDHKKIEGWRKKRQKIIF